MVQDDRPPPPARRGDPLSDSLRYEPSRVAWASSRFIAQTPHALARSFVYAVAALIVVGLGYSMLAQTLVAVEASGTLATRQALLPVPAPVSVTVAKLHVVANQRVAAGDILLESADRVTDEEADTIAAQAQSLQSLLSEEERGACKDCAARLNALAQDGFQTDNTGQVREKLGSLRKLCLDLSAAVDASDRFSMSTMATRRRLSLASTKLKEIRDRGAESMLAMQVESLTNEAAAAQSELAERRRQVDTQLSQARNQLAFGLTETLKALEVYRSQSTIVAPIAGVVTELAVSGPGQIIGGGQAILKIIPSEGGLVADVIVANKDIARVKEGLPAHIKLEALPERDHGVLNATVEVIDANVANGKGGSDEAGGAQGQGYRVRLALERQSFVTDGVDYPFRVGMTLRSLIIIRHESLFVAGVRKIFNISGSSSGAS